VIYLVRHIYLCISIGILDGSVVGIIAVGAQVAGAIHPPRRTRAARVVKILYMFEFPPNVYWSGWYL